MPRALLVCAFAFTGLVAQVPPEWDALIAAAGEVDTSPPAIAALPQDVLAWAEALTAPLDAGDRETLFADGLSTDDLGRAVALRALLDPDCQDLGAASPRALYRHVVAARVIEEVAAVAAVRGRLAQARVPEWLQDVRAPARARGRAALVRLLQAHGADRAAAKAVCEGAQLLLGGDEDVAALPLELRVRRVATERLGDAARVSDGLRWFGAALRTGDVEAARRALSAARGAALPTSMLQRELALERLEEATATLARVEALTARVAAGEGGPLVEFELACQTAAEDLEARARALIEAGCEHALPHTILAMHALRAGRVEEAQQQTARARSLPGRDARVAVLLAALAFPDVQRRLQAAPEDVETVLAVERLLEELDEALGSEETPAVAALRELRAAGWPQASGKELALRIAARFGGARRPPATSQGFSMALTGALAGMVDGDGDVAGALRFLELPVVDALRQRPLLMRERASVATVAAVWCVITDADDEQRQAAERVAARARAELSALGDDAHARYLELAQRWAAAADADAQRAVLDQLGALEVSPVQFDAWLPGSAALVLGAPPDAGVDRARFVQLRAVTGADRDPLTLVPLAVTGMVRAPESSRSMVDYLRRSVQDGRARNLLAVAEIAGGASPAKAAARARQVLASEDWSESEARELTHGVWLRFQVEWDLSFNRRGPRFACRLRSEPVLLPKLEVAEDLRRLARRR